MLAAGWAPRRARVPLTLVSFACAWILAFLTAVSLALLIASARRSTPGDSGEGGSDSDGDGGLGRRPPDRPTGGGGPADPSWWPEFERSLARYMAQQERTKAQRGRADEKG